MNLLSSRSAEKLSKKLCNKKVQESWRLDRSL